MRIKTHLDGRKHTTPFLDQLDEHAVWTALLDLPESTVNRELVVRHPHVGLDRANERQKRVASA